MNWTEITQAATNDVWYISEISYFPKGQSELFLDSMMTSFQERIIFCGSELIITLWAVGAEAPAIAVVLKNQLDTKELVCAPQGSPELVARFPGVNHANFSNFKFTVPLAAKQTQHHFELFIETESDSVHFASVHLLKRNVSEIAATELKLVHQIDYLQKSLPRKRYARQLSQLCALLITICKNNTPPAIYAILGDTLEHENSLTPAIGAYRKAVELMPNNARFKMRLAQLLEKQQPSNTGLESIPNGISLSTSGDTALTLIVDMLYRSTPAYMYVRELFQNELDAIYRRWDKELEIIGQSDFTGIIRIEPDANDPKKLCFWGDGIGMTFNQVTEHLAKLVNSGNAAHVAKNLGEPVSPSNFGIGAKTSALPENTQGMVYRTLPFGESEGIEFSLWKNPNTFLYEIKAWRNGDKIEHYRKLATKDFAEAIQKRGSGACATLLGNSLDEDTFAKAENLLTRQVSAEQTRKGIAYFLNSRYFTLPAIGLDVQVAERNEDQTLCWQTIIGQKAYLNCHALQSGVVPIKAVGLEVWAHWWILSESAQDDNESFNGLGHVGLLWKNELYYNPNESQRMQRLQLNSFGIHFGEERVVIYIEPCNPELVDSHPSRTRLMHRLRDFNATDFGEQFAHNMPNELDVFQKSFFINDTSGDKIEGIKHNLAVLGIHKGTKMRQYASALLNRGKARATAARTVAATNDNFEVLIPGSIWREFDPETQLFAAEWDNKGYVIKFNLAWPQYQKTLATLITETRVAHTNYPFDFIKKECENQLRFEYLKIVVEILFSSYSMMEYSNWTDRMIESQLLTPAALTAALQYNSSMHTNVKMALTSSL